MTPPEPQADDTIRVSRPARGSSTPLIAAVAGVALLLAIAGGAGWWLWSGPTPARITSVPAQVAPAPSATSPEPQVALAPSPAPAFTVETASEDQILHHVPSGLTVFRLASNPHILVLDFASLHEQGMMLNRVAALIEKVKLPRDRVMNDAELAGAIQASGDTVETYYYGHDYSADALARFFSLAEQEHIQLNAEEQLLHALLQQVGWLHAGGSGGLISIPAVAADKRITLAARSAILRHELSHGEFFSDPNYAAYVHHFWLTALTEQERADVRRFLGKDEYDTHEEELMYNEMQAYLMFTRDPLFFTPDMAGLSRARLTELQEKFLAGMPAGWLREVLASYRTATATR